MQYDGSPLPSAPFWGRRWPGRVTAELDHLRALAVGPVEVDEEYLANGILRASFDWRLPDERVVRLQATYPDTFPRLRPHVQLLGDPSTFPKRHVGPNGELCLLGRDSRFWLAGTTLADLLSTNLENALYGVGEEDPQGEPAEVWWNNFHGAGGGSYLLVDSGWDLKGASGGLVEIIYRFDDHPDHPSFRGVVKQIWNGDGDQVAERTQPLPPSLKGTSRMVATWKRRDDLPMPSDQGMRELIESMDYHGRHENTSFGSIRPSLTVKSSELQFQKSGDGYVCVVTISRKRGNNRSVGYLVVPVYRDGETDLGHRVPAVEALRTARVGVVGLGSIGSPVAIQLARNGVGKLHVLDHDVVEPGNTVRWALGSSAWGQPKAAAVADYVGREYARTEVVPHQLHVGFGATDGRILEQLVDDCDLVIDASASTGVTRHLADICKEKGVVLVSVAATANLKGGTVSIYHPNGACPICREYAYHNGVLPMAPGAEDYSELTQPPGCAENTFTGESYDLEELSLQAVRAAVAILSGNAAAMSQIQTLELHDGTSRIPPRWSSHDLAFADGCSCPR